LNDRISSDLSHASKPESCTMALMQNECEIEAE